MDAKKAAQQKMIEAMMAEQVGWLACVVLAAFVDVLLFVLSALVSWSTRVPPILFVVCMP